MATSKFSSDQIVSASMFLPPGLMRDSFSAILRFSLSSRNYYINLIVAGIPRVRFLWLLVCHGCFRLLLPSNLCLLSCWAATTLWSGHFAASSQPCMSPCDLGLLVASLGASGFQEKGKREVCAFSPCPPIKWIKWTPTAYPQEER